jgi:hypothetical protein
MKCAGVAALLGLTSLGLKAADHVDAPGTDTAPGRNPQVLGADMADVFIFRRDGALVGAITFAGTPAPRTRVDGLIGSYDPDVLYLYNIDTNADARPEFVVKVRFGRNGAGQWGVEFEDIPGAGAKYVFGPVETVLRSRNGLKVFAGRKDDPFFFDVQGFNATLATFGDDSAPDGSLQFNGNRDSFGTRNLTAVVFEMDLATIATRAQNNELRVWATTERLMR